MRNYKLERLQKGESFVTSEKGTSMMPILKSGQKHIISPTQWETVEVGDILLQNQGSFLYSSIGKKWGG